MAGKVNKRVCTSCGETIRHYAKGLCRGCYDEKRGRKYYQENRIERLAYVQKYRLKNCDKIRARKQKYNLKNRTRINKRSREYYHNGSSDTVGIRNYHGKLYRCCGNGKPLHRVIAEKVLGRKLKSHEVVHHHDENGLNNIHNNLLICTRSYHACLHHKMNKGKE